MAKISIQGFKIPNTHSGFQQRKSFLNLLIDKQNIIKYPLEMSALFLINVFSHKILAMSSSLHNTKLEFDQKKNVFVTQLGEP